MTRARRVFAIAGGGTGGHVTPALALAEAVVARGDAPFLLGGEIGLERRLVPEAGFELVTLPSGQMMGRGLAAKIRSALTTLRGVFAAWNELRRRKPDVLISVGGYASVPGVLAAFVRGVPIALVEPNAMPGRANRLAARLARAIFLQFEDAAARFEGSAPAQITGAPLRADLVAAFRSAPPRHTPGQPLRVFVFGGSQGARQINEAMMDAASRLDPNRFEIFHQTGEADQERVAGAYAATALPARVVPFEPDMPTRYAESDLAVCRSGALTLAELALARLPALLVPYPFAADDHQAANARAATAAGAARLLPSQPLSADDIVATLEELAENPDHLVKMSEAQASLARPDAAGQIVEACAAWTEETR